MEGRTGPVTPMRQPYPAAWLFRNVDGAGAEL